MKAIDRSGMFIKYQNKWITLEDDDTVISSGKTLDEAIKKADKKGFKNPVIAKIPDMHSEYLL